MNPPVMNRHNHPNAAASSRPALDDPSVAPLTGEDLIGDLDPGWLDWRDEQSGR